MIAGTGYISWRYIYVVARYLGIQISEGTMLFAVRSAAGGATSLDCAQFAALAKGIHCKMRVAMAVHKEKLRTIAIRGSATSRDSQIADFTDARTPSVFVWLHECGLDLGISRYHGDPNHKIQQDRKAALVSVGELTEKLRQCGYDVSFGSTAYRQLVREFEAGRDSSSVAPNNVGGLNYPSSSHTGRTEGLSDTNLRSDHGDDYPEDDAVVAHYGSRLMMSQLAVAALLSKFVVSTVVVRVLYRVMYRQQQRQRHSQTNPPGAPCERRPATAMRTNAPVEDEIAREVKIMQRAVAVWATGATDIITDPRTRDEAVSMLAAHALPIAAAPVIRLQQQGSDSRRGSDARRGSRSAAFR
eukprot:GHVU01133920.1.p1 GENE.GHVU01133920.1~~GHVU01133920.1.p1  ORF type:complete len:357 (-),score=39.73 GHVU01133920.1:903-1973(-)